LTDKQTVEAHALAKKIAKKMGINLKESADALEKARKTFAAASPMGPTQPGIPPYGKPGSAKAREAAKTAAKEATKPKELTTTQRMLKKFPNLANPSKVDYSKTSEFTSDPNRKMSDTEELIQTKDGRTLIVPKGSAFVKRTTRSKK
jgi:hypothetical protein